MTTNDLLEALARLRVETGSLACFGCGYEHNCSVRGCQILREAATQLEHFTAENRALRNVSASKPAKRSLNARVTYLREMVKELNAQREKAEAERDALLEIAKNGKDCDTCKNCAVCVKPGTDVAHWCDRCEENAVVTGAEATTGNGADCRKSRREEKRHEQNQKGRIWVYGAERTVPGSRGEYPKAWRYVRRVSAEEKF